MMHPLITDCVTTLISHFANSNIWHTVNLTVC